MQKTAIAVSDFDGHDCKLGPEGGCGVCQAKAEFYRLSRQKWERLQEKWRQVRERMNRPHQPDPMVIAAIMTTDKEDNHASH